MRIELLQDIAGFHGLGRTGTIVSVAEQRARNLIRGGLAREVLDPIPPLEDLAAGPELENGGEDEDGDTVQITLWNDEIDKVEANDTVKITDGWVKEWNNQLQVSTGRSGTIEKIE